VFIAIFFVFLSKHSLGIQL